MPAAPVFAHALGQVGIIEVFGQFQTKEAADADGHIAVTGKVKIQLQHVGNVAQHQNGGRQRFGRDGNNPLIDQCQLVCNQGFFGKAKDKPFDAVAKAVGCDEAGLAPGVQLGKLLPIPHDGAGWSMPEESQKHKEAQRTAGRDYAPGGYVNAVADGGEYIKTDAQRQCRRENGQQGGKQSVHALGHKSRIFKQTQNAQVGQNQKGEKRFFAGNTFQYQGARPVQCRQPYQNGRTPQAGPGKEKQAESTQDRVAQLFGKNIIHSQCQRQKYKNKLNRRKCHTVAPHLS